MKPSPDYFSSDNRRKNPRTILNEAMEGKLRDSQGVLESDKGYREITEMMRLSAECGEPMTMRVAVSPITARWLLERNASNRAFSETKAAQYSLDMRENRWVENGEGFSIADTGELNNGQHRLVAIVHSGATIMTNMTVGLTRASRGTNDIGLTRSAAAVLAINGTENAATAAAMTRLIIGWEQSDTMAIRPARETSIPQIEERIRKDARLVESAEFARVAKARARNILSAAQLGFLHYVLGETNRVIAERFLLALATGLDGDRGLDADDPRFVARERLAKDARILGNPERVEVVFRAWNLWRRNKTIAKFMITGNLPVLVR